MPIEFDGPNSKVSANVIEAQSGSTITIQSGHNLSGGGSGLTALPAANLTGTLPAISGVNLTALNATQLTSGTLPIARIADDAITLAKMAGGTDGQIITYDASGNHVAVGPGTDGQVLTSTGAGSPPAFETATGISWARSANQSVSANTSSAVTKITLTIEEQSSDSIFSISSGNIVTSTPGKYRMEGRTAFRDGKDSSTGSAQVSIKIGTSADGTQIRSQQTGQNYNEPNSTYPDHPVGCSHWDIFTLGSGTHYISMYWLSTTFWNSGSAGFVWMLTKL